MRTTLELPDDLMRSVKVRAAQTDRTLTEAIAALLRSGLAHEDSQTKPSRVVLPLVHSARLATEAETSPDRMAQIEAATELENVAR